MTVLDPRALKAARTAYQSAIPDGCWYSDGGETDAPIRAAITAYVALSQPQAGEPVAVGGLYGPFGWLNGCRGLSEDSWELESDPLENSEEYFAIPLYALVDPFKEVGPLYASPQPAIGATGQAVAPQGAVSEAMVDAAHASLGEVRQLFVRKDDVRVILTAALQGQSGRGVEARERLTKRPVEFRVRAHGQWLHFEDEQMAQESAEMRGTDYQGLYVLDGTPLYASPTPKPEGQS